MKFKVNDIIKCNGKHFSERIIVEIKMEPSVRYVTKFLEDDSIVESDATIIDANYLLK